MRALSYLLRALITNIIVIIIILACTLTPPLVDCIVIFQVKFETLISNRTDYALVGESLELTSHYIMFDEVEDIKEVKWFKDGQIFIEWNKYQPGIKVMDMMFKGHVDNNTKFDRIILNDVTQDMHGQYKCRIRTDLTTWEQEVNLQIITHRPCTFKDWTFSSDPGMCREHIRFNCRRMFPKPVPSCGLYDERTDKLIEAVSLSINEEPASKTYHIEYVDTFDLVLTNGSVNSRLANLLEYAGHLIFKCDIEIRGTSWRHSVEHKMFDFQDACDESPLDAIKRLRAIVNQLARARLAKTNHVIHGPGQGREFRHLEDADMITANMKYELFSPSTLQWLREDYKHGGVGHAELKTAADPTVRSEPMQARIYSSEASGPDLNCWQKPRWGTVARVSCGSSMVPLGDNTARNPAKLTGGSNLLQCRPSGWVPIPESDELNNEILDHNKTYKSVLRKKPSRQTTTTTTTTTQAAPTQALDLNSVSSNLDSDDSSATASANTNISFEFGPEPAPGIPITSYIRAGDKFRTSKHKETSSKPVQWLDPDLAPTQIAKLLPSCKLESTKPRHYHPNNHLIKNSDRVHQTGPNSLGSTYATGSGDRHKTHASQRDGTDQKWYTFSASAASSSSPSQSPAHMRSLFTSLIVSSFVFIVILL